MIRFEYDPNRSGELMLVRNMSTNEFSYVIRPIGVSVGAQIYSFPKGIPSDCTLSKTVLLNPGNCLPLRVRYLNFATISYNPLDLGNTRWYFCSLYWVGTKRSWNPMSISRNKCIYNGTSSKRIHSSSINV